MSADFSEDLVTYYTGNEADSHVLEHLLYLRKGEVPWLNLGLDIFCYGYNTSLSQAIFYSYPELGQLDVQQVDKDRVLVGGVGLDLNKIGASSV